MSPSRTTIQKLTFRKQNGLPKNTPVQFQVPQYIDVEDKIVGPLTIGQFLYIASAFLFSFITYFFFAAWFWFPLTILVGVFSVAFAFVRYNNRSLFALTAAAFRYLWQPRTYVWKEAGVEDTLKPRGLLALLGLQLDTSVHPLHGREQSGPSFFRRAITGQDTFEIVRRVTGDREIAKRVDYR